MQLQRGPEMLLDYQVWGRTCSCSAVARWGVTSFRQHKPQTSGEWVMDGGIEEGCCPEGWPSDSIHHSEPLILERLCVQCSSTQTGTRSSSSLQSKEEDRPLTRRQVNPFQTVLSALKETAFYNWEQQRAAILSGHRGDIRTKDTEEEKKPLRSRWGSRGVAWSEMSGGLQPRCSKDQ